MGRWLLAHFPAGLPCNLPILPVQTLLRILIPSRSPRSGNKGLKPDSAGDCQTQASPVDMVSPCHAHPGQARTIFSNPASLSPQWNMGVALLGRFGWVGRGRLAQVRSPDCVSISVLVHCSGKAWESRKRHDPQGQAWSLQPRRGEHIRAGQFMVRWDIPL